MVVNTQKECLITQCRKLNESSLGNIYTTLASPPNICELAALWYERKYTGSSIYSLSAESLLCNSWAIKRYVLDLMDGKLCSN